MSISNIYLGEDEAINKAYLGDTVVFERGGAPSYDTATQALLDQATGDGYTAASGDTLTALDTFIATLKSTGIWTLLDVVWLPATNGDSDFACYNLKDPTQFNLTKVNSPTHDSGGFTGDGISAFLDTGLNLLNDGVNYTRNSSSAGVYMRSLTAGQSEMGACNATGSNGFIIGRNFGNRDFNSINNGVTNNAAPVNTDAGLFFLNRTNSTSYTSNINGSVFRTYSRASTALENTDVAILARKNSTTPLQFSTGQVSFSFLGGDLSSQATAFYNAIQTYMTSIGKQV